MHQPRERQGVEQLITNDEMRAVARDLVDGADVVDAFAECGGDALEGAIDADEAGWRPAARGPRVG